MRGHLSDFDRAAFIAVHKPVGVSSRHVVDIVSRALGVRRVGHCGTLDPIAEGVLIVAVGKATQLVEYVQRMQKTYEATFELGANSDTDDARGNIVRRDIADPPGDADVRVALAGFVGRIWQRPPAYSAVKVAGERAYRRARVGQRVELAPRAVVVHAIENIRYEFPVVQCRITCGSGTYMRAIGRDLGEQLGTGAMMTALCRTAIGGFQQTDAAPLDVFQTRDDWPRYLQSLDKGLTELPAVTLGPADESRFRNGQRLALPFNEPADAIAVWSERRQLLGIGRMDAAGLLRPVKGGFAPMERNGS